MGLGWFEVYERIIKQVPPKQFPSIEVWLQVIERSTYKKFLKLIEIPERKEWAFPRIDDEEPENYPIRLRNAIAIAKEKANAS
jgi:hypothetical protein